MATSFTLHLLTKLFSLELNFSCLIVSIKKLDFFFREIILTPASRTEEVKDRREMWHCSNTDKSYQTFLHLRQGGFEMMDRHMTYPRRTLYLSH